jgi:two-component sensor histidine kinase
MTPVAYSLVWVVSVVTFAFGTLAFPTLALVYWRQSRKQRTGAGRVFPVFTICCAAAFLLNLGQRFAPDLEWLGPPLDLVTGIIPALIVHVIAEEEGSGPRWLPAAFYTGSAALAILIVAAPRSWSDRLESAPNIALATSAITGLILQVTSRRPRSRYRAWVRGLLIVLVVAAAIGSPFFSIVPDYILLAFFAVTLYYKERLVFFDLFLKRGAYFLGGSIAVTLLRPSLVQGVLFICLWLAGPWVYTGIAQMIDRVGLRRRYSAADAERLFIAAVQPAKGEADLRDRAAAAFEQIFEAPTLVKFGESPVVELTPRRNGVPYLSDDLHLQQSLTRTLGIVLENVRFREREEQLRLLAGRAELKALRAQINPHFLFNALNAIAGLIHINAAAAEETVEQLAEVFRYVLRKSEHEWVRLDEEIDFVRAYLQVEQARFGERLAVEIDVAPLAGAIQIPAMCVQPLVENAIKHGTSQVEGQGRVAIRARLADGVLSIDITDNGPGFAAGPSEGHGLHNIADRLSGYYGSSASLAWTNNHGAQVSLRIPNASSDRR